MISLSGSGGHFGLSRSLSIALGLMCCVGATAVAADEKALVTMQVAGSTRVLPLKSVAATTTIDPQYSFGPSSAHLLVPDGSSVVDNFGANSDRWYATDVEPGKSYVIEAFDPYSYPGSGSVNFHSLALYAGDGVSPPPEASTICSLPASATAPGFATTFNGERCIFRTWYPAPGNTQDKRAIYIQVTHVATATSTSFVIRVRETTIYGRWTTNGYDFHVELQNTSATDMCAWVEAYPNSGTTYNGASPKLLPVVVPAYGANKVIIPNGTLVGSDNRGTLRINTCATLFTETPTFTTGALHVSTYAFNPITKQFLYFFPWTANNGNNGNSF